MRYIEIIGVSRANIVIACKYNFLSPIANIAILIIKLQTIEILILSIYDTWENYYWCNQDYEC